ncbi:hypothetical protein M378DRAFT_199614 [Amanita muscaria Koide BX008]|uniref:F-box domain-containing protein n=1 Tax=Amanita muscaria (strain Koide BX008) TaxID=946122 RepID=A0A0C2WXP6_AMAMK|nr:hypothetical protein M378DRAFT_199614 [Amanita muscaria Koide BX008]
MLQFLANDLIYEILCHFLPELQLSVAESDLFPWYLGKICNSWRTVFISSPRFWSTLDINIDACLKEELPYHDSIFELVQLALKRSNGCPLSLSITMHRVFEKNATSATIRMRTKDILEMLVTHSMYWRDLCLVLHRSCYPTLYKANGQLPVLRSIKVPLQPLQSVPQQIGSDLINFQDIFTNATQLTRVHSFFMIETYWRINWSPVTVIHLVEAMSLDDVIPTLRQTSALEELVVGIIRDRMDPDFSIAPVHLPFLKVLYFPTLMFVSLLHTPGLEELYIAHNHWPVESDTDPLPITTVSGYFSTVPNLRKLAIYPVNPTDTLPILKQAPSKTRELAMYGSFISQQLTFAAANCAQLHNLKTISIGTRSHEIPHLLAKVKGWAQERQSATESGIGPFKNLAQFSLDFVPDKNCGILKPVKRLKRVLEEQGINFVSRIITESEMNTLGMPPFNLF